MSFIDNLANTFNQVDLDQAKQYAGNKIDTVEDYMRRTEPKGEPDYVRGFVAGLIGGLIGTVIKNIVDRNLPTDQPREEQAARLNLVREAANTTDTKLTTQQKGISEQTLNLGFGTLVGGVYGVLAEAIPDTQVPVGVPFGATLWTATHKTALPLLDLAPASMQDPASRQLGQLAGHIAYGATVEIVRRGVRHVMDEEDLL